MKWTLVALGVAAASLEVSAAWAQPWDQGACECEAGGKDRVDICLDITGNDTRLVKMLPGNLLAPNRSLRVVVHRPKGLDLELELSGTRGIDLPVAARKDAQAAANLEIATYMTSFAPRKSGPADLVIKTRTGTADFAPRYSLEIQVDQRFWGSARFGIGTLFGTFPGYEARTLAGSQTAQILESSPHLQFEFVAGFAPYVEALWGGRSYADASCRDNIHVAPFVGFGLLGQSVDKLDALTSVHVGAELEFASDFSLAFTAVLRRSRRLADGYAPNSAVEPGLTPEQLTVPASQWAFGVVLNASPSFLRFAQGGTAAESK